MNYQQALDYVYSFANFETRPADQQTRADYTLDRMWALMGELGRPQDRYPTVHVAGTKGKGSTAAMLTSVLTAAGYHVGLYISPHLHTYRERIRIGRRIISEAAVIEWLEQHRSLLDPLDDLTTFEITTALAFDYFAQQGVDVAIIEVGLGGRIDTTNVITPILSVITSISLDHTAILGDTLAEIAYDKAGIIKPEVPVVTAPQPADALAQVQRVSAEVRAPLVVVGEDWGWKLVDMQVDGQTVELRTPAGEVRRLRMSLIGEHEAQNAAVVVAGIEELRRQLWAITPAHVAEGLRTIEWPGRTELLNRRPWVMVDGAHNGASAQALLNTVERLLGQRRIVLVFGASIDKKIDDMFEVLLPAADDVIVVAARHPRAAAPGRLREMAGRHGYDVHAVPDVGEALLTAVAGVEEDDLVLVTGSLFVAGEARLAWFRHNGQSLPAHDPPIPA